MYGVRLCSHVGSCMWEGCVWYICVICIYMAMCAVRDCVWYECVCVCSCVCVPEWLFMRVVRTWLSVLVCE